jgi:hypothetical protein
MNNLQVVHWPVEKLIPFATNARTHSDEQVAQIAASIAEFGFSSGRTGFSSPATPGCWRRGNSA